MHIYNLLICFVICCRKKRARRLAAEQSTIYHPYTVVRRQCLVLQFDILPRSVANATLHVNEMHLMMVAVAQGKPT